MNFKQFLEALQAQAVADSAKAEWTAPQWDAWLKESVVSPTRRVLSSQELLAWSGANQRFRKISLAAEDVDHPAYSVANVAKILIMRESTSLDLNLTDRQNLLAYLVGANVLEQADADSLYSSAAVTAPRYETLGLSEYHDGDLAEALRRLNNAQ